jgi:hypoxanthine phosphoribosyltransferase
VTVDGEDVRLAPLAPGIRVLVADDICGSGATLAAVTRRLADSIRPMAFTTCTLCRNEGSGRTPDLWVWDVRDWVAFPWEPTPAGETVPLPAPTSVQRARS